ncbi:PucR family transcriptional regulator [Pseudonocardia sulfidoxydans NBRC 16205]|uniref:PucR family transcriptional regulator n=1 Tax=Pseudonocardia sulfidoxydans NBRC 16205 TaxID=1223511 RepID=A0A511DIV9_9PSEU|nr:helix-turn-helix domain-containing protein [Pseudonocardia sulfidoxydans]GEL23694.1 PucR family transcriptional regulator [Pseudonocardia sulfidoxydans NBRC 16205]
MPTGLQVLRSPGDAVVRVLVAGTAVTVGDIHLAGDTAPAGPGALVVAIGTDGAEAQEAAVRSAAGLRAAGLVLRAPVADGTVALARAERLTLAAVDERMDWSHLVWFLRSLLHRDGHDADDGAAAQQELFAMADTVARMLDASVTIEDPHSRVLAYSAGVGEADVVRTSTILGRAVPADVLRRLRASGVLRRLRRAERPIVLPAVAPDLLGRLVVPLRVGDEAVGSIWAIRDGELDAELEERLVAVGAAVALQVVRLRAGRDLAMRYSVERVREALRGGAAAGGDLAFASRALRVVALGRLTDGPADDPADDGGRDVDLPVWRTFLRRHAWPEPILGDVDGVTFAIVDDGPGAGGWSWLRELVADGGPASVAASRAVVDVAGLPGARREAAEALVAAADLGRRVVAHEDVWTTVVLRRATAAVATVAHDGLARLHAADEEHGTPLAATLRAWLECWGDVNRAAADLHVHPNTVRLRMRRVRALLGSDLDDGAERAATLLLLRAST